MSVLSTFVPFLLPLTGTFFQVSLWLKIDANLFLPFFFPPPIMKFNFGRRLESLKKKHLTLFPEFYLCFGQTLIFWLKVRILRKKSLNSEISLNSVMIWVVLYFSALWSFFFLPVISFHSCSLLLYFSEPLTMVFGFY